MRQAIFLDWFGVIADGRVMSERWRRVEARFLKDRYGGSLSHWMEVHDRAFRWYSRHWSQYGPNSRTMFRPVWKRCEIEWMKKTLTWGGVQPPTSENELFRLDRELTFEVTRRIDPLYSFARKTLRALVDAGNQLFLVSGMDSTYVRGAMEATGLETFFDKMFSPDQLNAFKGSLSYWKKILKLSGIRPSKAVVVDDKARFLRVPAGLGVQPVLVGTDNSALHYLLHIASLGELPRALARPPAKS